MTLEKELSAVVKVYSMPASGVELIKKSPPLVLAGISAAGKETIAAEIVKQSNYRKIPSYTTRPARLGETEGDEHFFVDSEHMLRLIKQKAFFETAKFHGDTVYGSGIDKYKAVLSAGNTPLLILEIQGVGKFFGANPNLRPYFLLPPNFEEWLRRLNTRAEMPQVERRHRLATAKLWLEHVRYDSRYILIINDKKEETAARILSGEHIDQPQPHKVLEQLLANVNKS